MADLEHHCHELQVS
jgi:hypothetical protein